MKKIFSYILFLTLVIRPAYNVGNIAYYELNIDYIIENYCVNKEKPELQCNGKCHLKNQLAVTDTKGEQSFVNSLFKTFVPVYFQEYKSISFIKNDIIVLNNWAYSNAFNSIYSDQLDHPPQV